MLESFRRRLPEFVGLESIQTAHKYGIAYMVVCHALEVCGLRKEMVSLKLLALSRLY